MTTDRNQSIERLLRQTHVADPHGPGTCPDAETLAALADDALPAAARRQVEGHLADCHRCQALTAAMVRAETSAHATGGMAVVPWWRRGAVKWLVPAAAAATAVALWVAIPVERTPIADDEPIADAQMAPAAPPAAPAPTAPSAAAPTEAPVSPSRDASASARASAERSAGVAQSAREDAGSRAATRNESAAVEQEQLLRKRERLAEPAPAEGRVVGALTAAGIDVVSPDPQRRWRIGPGSTVQHSVDGGATWMRQETGASAELTAGAAPTPDVCWLGGRAGLILRTIDGGRQWQRIAFPETVDLTAIAASSALIAILDAADGRRFRTTDGGLTWAQVQLP
jgi:hypothetical protein